MKEYLDQVAKSKGYDNWNDCIDWIARDGENPIVTEQIVEAYVKQAFSILVDDLKQEWLGAYEYEETDRIHSAVCETLRGFSKAIIDKSKE
jgi:hypothetical protein